MMEILHKYIEMVEQFESYYEQTISRTQTVTFSDILNAYPNK
jgi:hypothetical protein